MTTFNDRKPLLVQLERSGLQFDQQLMRALELSASNPDVTPEDSGFPDSYLTLALYRLNTVLTRVVTLDDKRYNIFHEYKMAPTCDPSQVVPGSRLCRVLETAAEMAKPDSVIGVGHYLKSIVALTLDEEPWVYGDWTIHNTFSAETLLIGLGHTAWTSVNDAPEVSGLLESVGARDPVQDHQYLLTIENGRLVFRTTSIVDTYSMTDARETATRLSLLTHFADNYTGFLPSDVLELEDLVNHPRVREADLQRFFEHHPSIFRMWEYRDVFPHVFLTREDDGELIPDFVLLDRDLHKAMVVDLKLPQKRVVVGGKDRRRLSAPVLEAKTQLLRYRDWFDEKHNRAKLQDAFGMQVYRPRIGVIIGRRNDFASELERQRIIADNPEVELATYDDVLEYAKRRLLLVQQAAKGK